MNFIKENITIDPKTKCWNWNKSVTGEGYGQFTREKKYWTTHRFVYTQIYGEIPKDLVVRHICHNPRCCNPEHLCLGTHKDNWKDSEENHRKASAKQAKGYYINGVLYRTFREAVKLTKLTPHSLNKFTDKETRIFNVELYRHNCKIARCKPKI